MTGEVTAPDEVALRAKLAENLRASPTMWNGNPIPTGFSYGAFELKPGDTADLAITRADEAMYVHKRAAR